MLCLKRMEQLSLTTICQKNNKIHCLSPVCCFYWMICRITYINTVSLPNVSFRDISNHETWGIPYHIRYIYMVFRRYVVSYEQSEKIRNSKQLLNVWLEEINFFNCESNVRQNNILILERDTLPWTFKTMINFSKTFHVFVYF